MQLQYPKPFMSISDLTEMGLPREYLRRLSRVADAPIIRTSGRGKILFITADLNNFMKKYLKGKKIFA